MPENLIFVPESNAEKAKKILGERVVLALEIAHDSAKEYIKKVYGYEDTEPLDPLQGQVFAKPRVDPTGDLFISVFEQVFAALS